MIVCVLQKMENILKTNYNKYYKYFSQFYNDWEPTNSLNSCQGSDTISPMIFTLGYELEYINE